MGASVWVCGPPTIIPSEIEKMGAKLTYNIDDALEDADVVYLLRLQRERQKENFLTSLKEYSNYYGIDEERYKKIVKSGGFIMHPGPMNRGVEIKSDIAERDRSLILEQVTNGIAVRMAVLYLTVGTRR